MKYTQLTVKERYHIEFLIQAGYVSLRRISDFTGRHKSAISRELIRNKNVDGQYRTENVCIMVRLRRKRKRKSKLMEEHEDFIRSKFESGWSPADICYGENKSTKRETLKLEESGKLQKDI